MKIKIFGLLVALAVVGGLVVFAAHATGAYFSDTHSGTIAATIGPFTLSGRRHASGPRTRAALDFAWPNMLPGVAVHATIDCRTRARELGGLLDGLPEPTASAPSTSWAPTGPSRSRVNGTMSSRTTTSTTNRPATGTAALRPKYCSRRTSARLASRLVMFKFEYASHMTSRRRWPAVTSTTYPVRAGQRSSAGDGTGRSPFADHGDHEPNIRQPGVDGRRAHRPACLTADEKGGSELLSGKQMASAGAST